MTCKMIQPLLSEFVDGTLAEDRAGQVRTHLAVCADCAGLVRDLAALNSLLHRLPAEQTSAGFEARLAGRLEEQNRRAPSWGSRLAALWAPSPPVVRPALALGAASLAVAGFALHGLLGTHPTSAQTVPTSPAVDRFLVSQCVEQHRNETAAQPLSDPAAQNLLARLNGPAPGTPATSPEEENL